jgi:pimeloyl-[acyl-carrier protein] methyl ester esterase
MTCTLILLPGMDGTGEFFAPLTEALGTHIPTKIVRYPDLPLDYREHEEFARTQLPSDGAFVVLGESFSGPIAASLAAVPPPGMVGYVLCVSFVCCPRAALKTLRPFIGLTTPNRMSSLVAQYLLMGGLGSKALEQALRKALEGVSNPALRARMRAVSDVDVRDHLKKVRIPGLYLRATRDRLIPKSAAEIFKRSVNNARVVEIEGPHMLLQTRATECAHELQTFIQQLEPVGIPARGFCP